MAKRVPRLKTTSAVCAFLARIIGETYKGDLDPGLAARLGYLCNILKGCLDKEVENDILRRLGALEAQLTNERKSDADGPNLKVLE